MSGPVHRDDAFNDHDVDPDRFDEPPDTERATDVLEHAEPAVAVHLDEAWS